MKVGHFRQKIKPLMMPIAIVAGIFFHKEIEAVAFLAPALIFAMLLITFCRIRLSEVRIDRMSWLLLAVQLPVSLAAYFAVRPFSEVAAQGFFICIFCPTATAAPVITQMLGGSIARLVSFSLVRPCHNLSRNCELTVCYPCCRSIVGEGSVCFSERSCHVVAKFLSLSSCSVELCPVRKSFLNFSRIGCTENFLSDRTSVD